MAKEKEKSPTDAAPTTDEQPSQFEASLADDYYAKLLEQKIAAGLSKEDAANVVKWQREEDAKQA